MLGGVSAQAASILRSKEGSDFFTRLIMRVSPKSYEQALAEVRISRIFLENFSGDQVFVFIFKGKKYIIDKFLFCFFLIKATIPRSIFWCFWWLSRTNEPWIQMAIWFCSTHYTIQLSSRNSCFAIDGCSLHGQQACSQGWLEGNLFFLFVLFFFFYPIDFHWLFLNLEWDYILC